MSRQSSLAMFGLAVTLYPICLCNLAASSPDQQFVSGAVLDVFDTGEVLVSFGKQQGEIRKGDRVNLTRAGERPKEYRWVARAIIVAVGTNYSVIRLEGRNT